MALGAASAALATGIGIHEGDIPQTVVGDLGATTGLIGAGVLSKRKHEGELAEIEKAGDWYVVHKK